MFTGTEWPEIKTIRPSLASMNNTGVTLTIQPWNDVFIMLNKTLQYQVKFFQENIEGKKWDFVSSTFYNSPDSMGKYDLKSYATYRAFLRIRIRIDATHYHAISYFFSLWSKEKMFRLNHPDGISQSKHRKSCYIIDTPSRVSIFTLD